MALLSSFQALGSKLTVALPSPLGSGQRATVRLRFTTSPGASALQWLRPEQTAGGRHPYLFTQCQAIHARSFVPCQDTPAAKFTYTASVRVPERLTALMSALPDETGPETEADGEAHSEAGGDEGASRGRAVQQRMWRSCVPAAW